MANSKLLMHMAFSFFIICMAAMSTAQTETAQDSYEPEIPDNFTMDCINYNLTVDCGAQIEIAIDTKNVSAVDDACCRRMVVNTSEKCWEKIFIANFDDPCHFFRFTMDHCKKVVGTASHPSDDDTPTSTATTCNS